MLCPSRSYAGELQRQTTRDDRSSAGIDEDSGSGRLTSPDSMHITVTPHLERPPQARFNVFFAVGGLPVGPA